MKRNRLNAMPALPKFMVLLAIFVSASNANAFTRLSLVFGNQVRVNHLIRFQQPMSDPKNEPSREPICKPTKQMDLDAVLLNNLLPKKPREVDSKSKQNAELSSNIASTQPHGPCHDKNQSEMEMVLPLNLVGFATIKNQSK
jgi:hypothetical protein